MNYSDAVHEMINLGESNTDACRLIAQAENTGRTTIGEFTAVAYDQERGQYTVVPAG